MSRGGIQTCPRCGRVLMGLEPCANCASGYYASQSADSYGVTAQSNAPRWLLLVGALLLLALLCVVVSQRSHSPAVLSAAPTASDDIPSPPAPVAALATPAPTPDPDAEFWRRKSIRELREAEGYAPTREEQEYQDQVRAIRHFSTANDARAADYYLRRPELVGRR